MVSTTTNKGEACAKRCDEKSGEFLNFIRRKNPCSLISVFGLGVVLLVLGIITSTCWHEAFLQQIAKTLKLTSSNDSETTKLWLSHKVPQYLKVYMFNWTNPEQTLAGSEIPHFTECGPYVFKATVFKENVVWNENFTISYLQRRRWDFIPEMSNGSLTDQVTSINVVAIAFGYQMRNLPGLADFANGGIKAKGISLVITQSVESQLFHGYEDGILHVLKEIGSWVPPSLRQTLNGFGGLLEGIRAALTNTETNNNTFMTRLMDRMEKLDNIKDKFAWWYQKNYSDTHHFNIHTGEDDINLLGDVHSWDHKDTCRDHQKVHGSMGDLWPVNSAKGDRALLFIPDMCSSFDLINAGSTRVNGIDGVKFVGTRETMAPSISREPGNYVDTDLMTGIRNITSIVKAPVFISFPHFYQASEEYRMSVSGMNPDKEKHEFSITMQRDAGIVLKGHGRIQVNIMLEPSPDIALLRNLPTVLFPTIWFEQTGEIPADILNQLRFSFITVPRILFLAGTISVIIGIMILANGIVLVHLLYKPEPRKKLVTYINYILFKTKKLTTRSSQKQETPINKV